MISLSWCPISYVVTGPGLHFAQKGLATAEELEKESSEKLRQVKDELKKITDENKRAKVTSYYHYNNIQLYNNYYNNNMVKDILVATCKAQGF